MSELPPGPDESQTQPPPQAALRSFGRNMLRAFFPYQLTPFDAEAWQDSHETPQPPTTVVTYVKGLNRLFFTDEAGKETHKPQSGFYELERPLLYFSQIYMLLESGYHQSDKLPDELGVKPQTIARSMHAMEDALPDELFGYDRRDRDDVFYFGRLALACRLPNEAEIAIIDKDRAPLLHYDHALITKANSRYYLPLHSGLSIMAAHVIQTLEGIARPTAVARDIAAKVWGAMSIEERLLFVGSPYQAFGPARQINTQVESILQQLTNRLMLTREPRRDGVFTLYTDDLSVTLSADSIPEGALAHTNLMLLSPPGTSKEFIHELMGRPLTETALETARQVIGIVIAGKHVGNQQAIEILDFITQPEGRRAIRHVLEPSKILSSASEALRQAHHLLKLSMGYNAYTAAHTDRMVGGHRIIKAHGAARQISGRLPAVTKWHIGRND